MDEGKTVKKGDILIEMDKKDTEARLEQYANQITQLEAELKSATTEEIIQVGQNKTDIEKAELALEVAKVELRKLMESDIPKQLRDKKLAIEEKEIALQDAEDQVEVNKDLVAEELASQYDLDQAKLRFKRAAIDLETAKMDLHSYETYVKPLDVRKRESAVTEAERGRDRAGKRAGAQLSSKQARVTQKKVQLSRVKVRHDRQKKILEQMTLKAPTDGTVLYGDPDQPWMAERVKVGGQVWRSMVLITLPDPSEMAVVIEVHEADIDKVKTGMAAFITSETQKDVIYDGEVTKIDTVANAGRRRYGRDNVKRFRVEMTLKGKDLNLKPGTSARVEILIGEVADVVAVPLQAVFAKEGKHYCFRSSNGGKPVRVEVEPGKSNDSFVEIKSGLEEGDAVLLYDAGIADAAEPSDEDEKDEEPAKEKSEP